MMRTNKLLIPFAVGVLAAASLSASADTFTFDTASGSTLSGLPVNAEAIFTVTANDIKITLKNFQNDPTSVIQNLSGLSFGLTSGQTSGTLASSSGMERSIASNGTYTDGSTVSTGWVLTGLTLNVLGTPVGPAHTLIGGPNGSNVYGNANGSITGNGAHNPFLFGDLTFDLNVPGVTLDSSIKNVVFLFGTTGDRVGSGPPTRNVPDGGMTLMLLGTGLSGLGLVRRAVRK